ncbi:MAG: late competence development ComFB family protein [Aminipila sp.]
MPKKSNKTAHVLSLLTNGGGDISKEEETLSNVPNENNNTIEKHDVYKPEQTSQNPPLAESPADKVSEPVSLSKPEILVEVRGDSSNGSLSDCLKANLEKELQEQLEKKSKQAKSPDNNTEGNESNERPPYSPTFMAKFGIKDNSVKEQEASMETQEAFTEREEISTSTSIPTQQNDISTTDALNSQAYVLEKFTDDDDSSYNNDMSTNINPIEQNNNIQEAKSMTTKVLHNLAEEVVKSKTPEIMKSLNMCCCEDCMYDVIALTLNHTKPLYTVTEKGHLFQKLASYELQFGADLTSQITKACITVKINPKHHKK